MTKTYDVVTIGAGHNGLIAAAYLAKAGKQVLILERQPWVGGGVVTREITAPGFRHDQHSTAHILIQANPLLLNDELGLKSRYGLRYLYPDPPFISVFEDGSTLSMYRDSEKSAEDIAKFSARDAQAYRRFSELANRILPMLTASMYTPPVPVGAMAAMMDQSPEGREMMVIMGKSSLDIICEWFEDERVRLHLLKLVTENLQLPDEKGTGIGLFMLVAFQQKYGIGVAQGGSGALTDALMGFLKDHGATVLTETSVEKILVQGGRAVGVRTKDEEYRARDCVIGAIHPHLLHRYIDDLPERVDLAARKVQVSSFSAFAIHGALREPMQFHAGEHVKGSIITELLPMKLEALRRSFDELRYGRLPAQALMCANCPSNVDPSRAPAGKATFLLFSYAPYDLADGGPQRWDSFKEAHADSLIEQLARFSPNMNRDNFIARTVYSPLDMERGSDSFQKGDIHGAAPFHYQFGTHRPTPDLGRGYGVPGLERFFLVGPFMHPGGGVFGAGRATAMKAFEALDMDFDKVAEA